MCKEAAESRILSKRDRPRHRRAEPAAEGVFIPGINLAASVINAVIAGVIVTALGEGSIYAFEQVYLGNKDISDIDWVKKIIKSKLSPTLVEKAKPILSKLTDASTKKEIMQVILELAATVLGKKPEAGAKE